MIAAEQTTTAQEMVTTADTLLRELQGKVDALNVQMTTAHNELATIADAREFSAAQLTNARLAVEQAEQHHHQATGYAKLAQRTPNQHAAVKAASATKKTLQEAHKALETLERETADAEQVASAREQDLSKHIHEWQAIRDGHLAEMGTIRAGSEQAMAELGKEKYAAILLAYQHKQGQVSELAEGLIAGEIELHDLHQSALHELSPWPDLQKEIARLVEPDDPTIRVMLATLQHIETLMADIPHVRLGSMPQLGWDLRDVLFIRELDLWMPGSLAEHKRRLEQVLTAYRQVIIEKEEI